MKFVNKLFKYNYIYFVQGTEERGTEYVLLYVPENASFNNNRSTVYEDRNKPHYHEIDIESITDMTIKF